ncbi:MAG: hypothetical protein P8R42_02300 [Candidatus Binatia bacterium]|nr:hypothetical protein [Candidatus Binatia bacterium]
MNGDIAVGAFEGVGSVPAAMHMELGGDPLLDALAFGGLTLALVAAALLLVLNREEPRQPA